MEQVNEHDLAYRSGDHGPKYLFRGPHFEWGVIFLKAGQAMTPHRHEVVEETFYFETGTPTFMVNGEPHRVKPGDVFKLDPGEPHDIINDADTDTRVIFIKTPYEPADKVDL